MALEEETTIRLSKETVNRLNTHKQFKGVGKVESFDDVINRILNSYEENEVRKREVDKEITDLMKEHL